MCAASPARYSFSCCIGSTTNERIGVTPFSKIGPRLTSMPKRRSSSSQIASSDHGSSSGSHWRYMRVIFGERSEASANPRSWCA